MKKIIFFILICVALHSTAQTIAVGTGTTMVLSSGTYVIAGGGVKVENSTAAIDNSGYIQLAGNWTNNGLGLINARPGNVVFNGTSSQVLGGSASTTFNNLTINNSSGVTLSNNETVNGTLNFINGIITTGSNSMVITSAGGISGASTGTGWVNGNLEKDFTTNTGTQTFKYEIGDNTVYAPATLDLRNADVSVHPVNITGYIAATDANENIPTTNASNIDQARKVNRYWFMTENSNAGTFDSYDITLDFTNTPNTGSAGSYIAKKFNTSAWASTTSSVTGTTIKATNLVNFGDFEVGENGLITLNLNLFIQGYYIGGGKMSPLLQLLGGSANAVDTVIIQLDSAIAPYNTAFTATGILQSNGTLSCIFPAAAKYNSYYISIRHRNSIETWTKNSIAMTTGLTYDFTASADSAYGNNEAPLGDGKYGIYSGDITQDGNIDGSDDSGLINTLSVFPIGNYYPNDITGDAYVDENDYRTMQNNRPAGISIQRPH